MVRKHFLGICCFMITILIFFLLAYHLAKVDNNIISPIKKVKTPQSTNVSEDDYNSGITILGRVSVFNNPGSYPPNFDIIVLNHTDEPVIFSNRGYGLDVFWGDGDAKVWRKIEINQSIVLNNYNTPVSLDPHTDKWTGDNFWILNGSDIKDYYHYYPIRVYVWGIGDVTGKKYIAYWHVIDRSETPNPR